jgi:predicted acyl esterase
VAGAGFNGTHRESSRQPTLLVPGAEVALDIEMHFTSWVFPAGHRMRLVVSNAQWPMIWPTPGAMSTTLRLGGR